jgi:hypothetical protein
VLALIFDGNNYWFALKQAEDESVLSLNMVTHLARAFIMGDMLPAHQETRQGPLRKTGIGG